MSTRPFTLHPARKCPYLAKLPFPSLRTSLRRLSSEADVHNDESNGKFREGSKADNFVVDILFGLNYGLKCFQRAGGTKGTQHKFSKAQHCWGGQGTLRVVIILISF